PATRSVADERNAMRLPSSLIDGRSLAALPAAPPAVRLTSWTACVCWSRTKTSLAWLPSVPARLPALEVNASHRPSRLRLGSALAPLGSPPPDGTLERSITAQLARSATHATIDAVRMARTRKP